MKQRRIQKAKKRQKKISYSLILSTKSNSMNADGSKIIFGLGVAASVGLAVFVLYFAIR